MRKKVLMIAYIFPPLGGSGVYRTFKFVKYLRKYGWEPVIVSAKDPNWYHILKQDEYEDQIDPRTQIYRIRPIPLLKTLGKVWRFLKRPFSKAEEVPGAQSKPPTLIGIKGVVRSILSIPDEQIWWLIPALLTSLRLLRRDKEIRVIYTTSGPYTNHLAGLLLKLIHKKPWVADFRDLWSDNPTLFPNETWLKKVNAWLEKRVINFGDKIITTAESATEHFITKYPKQNPSKFTTITNGFDPDDFKDAKPEKFDKFVISYIGELYASRSPEPVLKAFEKFLAKVPSAQAVLYLVGAKERKYEILIKNSINTRGLTNRVRMLSQVSHCEAISQMLGSDVLLLIIGEEDNQGGKMYAAKIFEYLVARKPIVVVAPPGASAELVKQLGVGRVCDYQDEESVAQAFLHYYSLWERKADIALPNVDLTRYDRRYLTQRLAEVFDEIIRPGRKL